MPLFANGSKYSIYPVHPVRFPPRLCVSAVNSLLDSLRFDRPVNALYLVEHRVHRFLIAYERGQRYPRESVLDDLMEPDNDGPDAAIARVNALIKYARVAFTMRTQHVLIEHFDDLVEVNVIGRPGEKIAALRPAGRIYEPGLVQEPHKLAGICRRDALAFRDLRQRKALALG